MPSFDNLYDIYLYPDMLFFAEKGFFTINSSIINIILLTPEV